MDDHRRESLSCPFCSFDDFEADFLIQHVNLCHPETELIRRPSTLEQEPSAFDDSPKDPHVIIDSEESVNKALYTPCPRGCGEVVLRAEVSTHLDFHAAETLALDDLGVHDGENFAVGYLRYFGFFCTRSLKC
jgi:zinc finger-containing ubiquitin peptidase 1